MEITNGLEITISISRVREHLSFMDDERRLALALCDELNKSYCLALSMQNSNAYEYRDCAEEIDRLVQRIQARRDVLEAITDDLKLSFQEVMRLTFDAHSAIEHFGDV